MIKGNQDGWTFADTTTEFSNNVFGIRGKKVLPKKNKKVAQSMDEEKQELLKEKMVANSSKNSWTSADTMVANLSQNEEGKSKKV